MCLCSFLRCICTTNPKGKACHYYDIDYSATLRSLLVLLLSVAMIGIHVSMLNYCDSWGLKHTECKYEYWDLASPNSEEAIDSVNALAAWTILGAASLAGFFILACGCYRLHRYYGLIVTICWAWISYLDAKTLMHLYDSQNACNSLNDVDKDRCLRRYTIQFYQLIVLSWLQTLVLLNCAVDSFFRRDELTNEEYLSRKSSIKGKQNSTRINNINRMGYENA